MTNFDLSHTSKVWDQFYYPIDKQYVLLDYSIVIATKDRCPFGIKEREKNPLSQCLDSILYQYGKPKEIVIINDGCADETDLIVNYYKVQFAKHKIDLEYFKNKKSKGPGIAIMQGIICSSYQLILQIADDIILHPDAAKAAFELFYHYKKNYQSLGILALQHNRRSSHPTQLLPEAEIGKVNRKLRLTGCFESTFPQELFLAAQNHTLKEVNPVKLLHFKGSILFFDKEVLSQYTFHPFFKIDSYGMETHIGLQLSKKGIGILYPPYINVSGMHSAWGNHQGLNHFEGNDWTKECKEYMGLSLQDISQLASCSSPDTGVGRPESDVYYYRMIVCFGIVLYDYFNSHKQWIEKIQRDFIDNHESDLTEGRELISDKKKRIYIASLAFSHLINPEKMYSTQKVKNNSYAQKSLSILMEEFEFAKNALLNI